jgi:hypothetical protein
MEAYMNVDAEDPTFSTQSADRWQLGCQPYVLAMLYLQKYLLIVVKALCYKSKGDRLET